MDNILLIPGLDRPNPNNLFRDGQVGGWLDPYDLTKMWVDNAGTTPMTASDLGVGIGRIQSKGGPVITFEQATSGDRLVWGRHPVSGIRNLLERTEEFDNAYWTKANSTVVANVAANPINGTLDADRMTTSASFGEVRPAFTYPSTGTYTFKVYAKSETLPQLILRLDRNTNTANVTLTFATETVTTSGANIISGSATSVGDGWYLIKATANVVDAAFVVGYTGGSVTGSVLLWGAQIEKNATDTTYQKVTNRFDITETGQPDLYYFSGNGVNQSWSSNATVDFSGTNKVTVWAGLRKLSDAADGTVCELTSGSLDGQIAIDAPGSATAAKYQGVSRGTVAAVPFTTNAAFNAPHTASLVLEGDIAAPLARLSINGTVVSTITTSQGSGNYANANLHIGRRAGSSRPYNGYIYSLIIAGDNYDTRTIQQFSDWSLKPRRLITA